MANVSNLKINERSKNLRVIKLGNKNWENYENSKCRNWFILKGKYGNWQNY